MGHATRILRAIGLAIALVTTQSAFAASVIQMPFDQLVTDSEIAFEGRVVETRSAWNATRTRIVTHVTFEVADVLKGGPIGVVQLTFAGGTVDGMRMSVSGMRVPRQGEAGVYFVESATRDLLNPILGWNQGQFLVSGSDSNQRVLTSSGKPVVGFEQVKTTTFTMNEHEASGLTVGPRSSQGMTLTQFKSHVREVLEANRSSERREVAR